MSLLNTPIKIGSLELRSRLVMPPMATEKSAEGGLASEKLFEYYNEKSRGGYLGLVITEHSYVLPEGKASRGQLSVADDSVIPGLEKLADTVHRNGSPIFAQINHAGGAAVKEITGYEPVSASAVTMPRKKSAPAKEMDSSDIQKVIRAFAEAAGRVKKAGFDGVEIHSAHGYLLNQFFSPLTNHRKDAYTGDSISGRIKLHLDIIKAIREVVGDAFPIALRFGGCDYMEGGSTIEDAVSAAIEFEKAGIDLLDMSGGHCFYIHPFSKDQGYFSDLSEAVKKKVSIPVLLTGGIVTAEAAESLLQNKKADLIGVGRAILKDSDWAKNAVQSI
ncbi:MAG: NADH:flavin oxidoreductase [Clostridium sp.]|nr:NADH:flavin oxidoreductase [Clostridium sp.]